jgi:Tol biopolymer transport system component/energy-coupling factor transporter ATP-binding protein EcfA2
MFIFPAALIVAGIIYLATTADAESDLQMSRVQLTSTGDITEAALSPDGRYLVYGRDEGNGRQSLWLKAIDETPEKLDFAEEPIAYHALTFSSDNSDIYYVKYKGTESTGKLYRRSVQGRTETEIKNSVPRFFGFALAPDNSRLAFISQMVNESDRSKKSALVVRRISDGTEQVAGPPHPPDYYLSVSPAWKPDSKTIICAARSADPTQVNLVEIQPEAGKEEISTTVNARYVRNLAWLADGSGLLISTSEHEHGPFQMKYISYPDGKRQQEVTSDPNNYIGMSMSADSTQMVTVQDRLKSKILIADTDEESRAWQINPEAGGQLNREAGGHNDFFGFSWTKDGKAIVYESSRNGKQNIYLQHLESQEEPVNLTNNVGDNFDPSVGGQQGDYIVFASNRTGYTNIWRMDLDGQNQTQLTHGKRDFVPYCCGDGDWVFYTSEVNGRYTLRKVLLKGGSELPVTKDEHILFWPAASTDGSRLACFYDDQAQIWLAVMPVEGGSLKQIPLPATANTWSELRWIKEGDDKRPAITYIQTHKEDGRFTSNLWLQPLDERSEALKLTSFRGGRIFRYEWSPDGRRIVFSSGEITKDAYLFNLNRPSKLRYLLNLQIVQFALQHYQWLLPVLLLLFLLFVIEFTSLPFELLAKVPYFDGVVWLLYFIRGKDTRLFRGYSRNLKNQLISDSQFFMPLPVVLEGRETIPAEAVTGRVLEKVKREPVLITGPGGAGKSTLLRQLALSSLNDEELKKLIPVFINADVDEKTSLRDQLVIYMKQMNIFVSDTVLTSQLRKRMFFFIIDGVGESTEQETRRVLDEMTTLFPVGSDGTKKVVVALASRYYDGIAFMLNPVGSLKRPCRVELLQVDPVDLKAFCIEYLAIKRGQPKEMIDEQDSASLAEQIKALPLTPLIITLAIDEYERKGLPPSSMLGLFENYLSTNSQKEKLHIPVPTLFALLHHLAWTKFYKGRGQREVTEEQLTQMISQIATDTGLLKNYPDVTLRAIIHDLLRLGIMIRQHAKIRFWHDSFEDYLCAYNFYLRWANGPKQARLDLKEMKKEEVKRVFAEVLWFIEQIGRQNQNSEIIKAVKEPLDEKPSEESKNVPSPS